MFELSTLISYESILRILMFRRREGVIIHKMCYSLTSVQHCQERPINLRVSYMDNIVFGKQNYGFLDYNLQ